MVRIIALLVALTLSGCATVGTDVLKAGTTGSLRFNAEDVDAAIVIAKASNDPVAERCYTELRKYVDPAPQLVTKGPVSVYAAGRAAARAARAPLAEDVQSACAPLILDAGTFASRLALTLGK